jgi:serine/threonine protein kinase/Tol biopolymer transport system component
MAARCARLTPERWKRAEDLFHAARARPPGERAAFLAEACPEDNALRRDVESLLSEPVSDDGFLAVPTLGMAVDLDSEPATVDMTGRTLGGYRLELLIGAGGMGEVYMARDATLGRDVAIKILPRAFTSHPDRLARFEREARMLAALNHPNICAIYGFEQADLSAGSGQVAVRFLILELVEGETLADTLAHVSPREGGGLPPREALPIARQIAEALEVAHDKGIVHRDLKPANIKITPDGVVKVLDFGLAKAVSADGSSPDLTQPPDATAGGRRDGVVMGTARYMSPEQARGQTVDKRTDIWAFGCVLYEMLTGRATFPGDTASDTFAKILEREPDWSALPPTLRPGVVTLLKRCLEKDAKRRLRDIGDARIELDDALKQPAATDVRPPPVSSPPWWRLAPPALALAGLTALIVGFWPRPVWENPLANATFEKLTNWEGTEAGAQISPDGNFVVFLADHEGEFDLWLSQLGTGDPVNLTRDIAPLGGQGVIRSFGFSGDGEVWFALSEAMSQKKLIMPVTGGTARPFLDTRSFGASWSRDGTRLVYFDNTSGDPLFRADATGADPQRIFEPREEEHNHNPVWASDEQWIYFIRGVIYGLNETDEMDIWRVRPSGGVPERLTHQNAAMTFLAPLNARTLLYAARGDDRSGPWLWALDVETRARRRVSSGLEQYTSVSASRDGRRVVATLSDPTVSLFRVPLIGRMAEEHDAQPYVVPGVRALAPRLGRTALFYLSSRGTGDGLSRFEDGKALEIWKASEGALSEPPAISPDGQRVALIIRKEGQQHLHVMSADGTKRRELAPSIATQGTADWSPDGQWIVTGGRNAEGSALFKIPVDGSGEPVPLVRGKGTSPVWSPRDDLIIYAGPLVAGQVPILGVRPDGTPVELPDVRVRPGGYRFLPDGTGLVHLPRAQSRDFWLLDLATKQTRQVTRLDNQGRLRTFDITPDGKFIVFDRSRENSDIVLINLPN